VNKREALRKALPKFPKLKESTKLGLYGYFVLLIPNVTMLALFITTKNPLLMPIAIFTSVVSAYICAWFWNAEAIMEEAEKNE
jgi:hypothetical protein